MTSILHFKNQNTYIIHLIIEFIGNTMSIEDLNKYKQTIIDNFRWIKLEKDYAQFQLLLYQLMNLISQYEKLLELQDEIIDKHYQLIKHMEDRDLISDFDYIEWHQQRINEVSSWRNELDMLTEYKYQINDIMKQIEDGTAEQTLIEQEKELRNSESN